MPLTQRCFQIDATAGFHWRHHQIPAHKRERGGVTSVHAVGLAHTHQKRKAELSDPAFLKLPPQPPVELGSLGVLNDDERLDGLAGCASEPKSVDGFGVV
jgi:hypothetical protein